MNPNQEVKKEKIDEDAMSSETIIKNQKLKIESLEVQVKNLLTSLAKLNENVKMLAEENQKRAKENDALNKHGKGAFIMSSEEENDNLNENFDIFKNHEFTLDKVKIENKYEPSAPILSRSNSSSPERTPKKFDGQHKVPFDLEKQNEHNLTKALAKDIIRTIDIFRGKDDIGLEDFIQNVKEARAICNQPQLLLKFILAEKLADNAKRAIRFTRIEKYSDLFSELRKNLSSLQSSSVLRMKLNNVKQPPSESVRDFNSRFKQVLNELQYVIGSENSSAVHRKIALQIEEKTASKTYISNLKFDIAHQVRALRPDNLNAAQQEAVEAECWLKSTQQYARSSGNPSRASQIGLRSGINNNNNSNNNNQNSNKHSNFQKFDQKPFNNRGFNQNTTSSNITKPFNNFRHSDGQNYKSDPSRGPQNLKTTQSTNFRSDHHQPRPPHRTNQLIEDEEEQEDETNYQENTENHQTEAQLYQDDFCPSTSEAERQEKYDECW